MVVTQDQGRLSSGVVFAMVSICINTVTTRNLLNMTIYTATRLILPSWLLVSSLLLFKGWSSEGTAGQLYMLVEDQPFSLSSKDITIIALWGSSIQPSNLREMKISCAIFSLAHQMKHHA
uniref:Uncharacterized protein n=1 Tax=Opuntia streptacantha TaxID=393608 RepID=A0A7C9EDT5_OPUST